MIKRNRVQLIISSVIIILPILIGLIFWNELPDKMVTHWGVGGIADGWSSKASAVFFIPLFSLAAHWFCVFFTAKDPKNINQNSKAFGMVLWICPIVSLFANVLLYSTAFEQDFDVNLMGLLLIGFMFAVIGNYLPKCKQNSTIGIKVIWALENEENWNATHRIGGKVWFAGGIVMILSAMLPKHFIPYVLLICLILLVAIPIVYSYCYYKKQLKSGDIAPIPPKDTKSNSITLLVSTIIIAVSFIFSGILMFTGSIDISYGDSSFTVDATYWKSFTAEYASVDGIEYRENDSVGSRNAGLGSAKLLAGTFSNDEFGSYTRYSYTKCDSCVVLTINDKVVVINGKDNLSTKAIYDELYKKALKG